MRPTSPSLSRNLAPAPAPAAAEARALGDVARDLRGADHLAAVVADRRHRQRNRDLGAVLAPPDGLEVIDGLAGADAGQHGVFLALPIRGDDHPDRLADRLLAV